VKTVVVLLLTIRGRGVFFLLILRRNEPMADKPSDLVQGTLDMLIIEHWRSNPCTQRIAVRLKPMSRGVFHLNAGSLFVTCQRLERAGLIRSEWKAAENSRRARYYVLTDQGRNRLNSETREWGRQVAAIARILEAS
jgi:PadR family transcriptional regulator PadR